MTHKEKIKYIADYYGAAQYMQAAEECAGLIRALSRLQRAEVSEDRGRIRRFVEEVIEEIADVEVMTEQLKYMMSIPGSKTIEAIKEQKLNRQIERISHAETLSVKEL